MWLSQLLAAEYAGSNLRCLRHKKCFHVSRGFRLLWTQEIELLLHFQFAVHPFCDRMVQMLEQMIFFPTYFDLFRCFAQHLHPTSGSPGWSASITGPGTPGAQIPLSSNGFGCQQIPSSPFTRERRPFCTRLLWRSRELKRSKLTKIIQE